MFDRDPATPAGAARRRRAAADATARKSAPQRADRRRAADMVSSPEQEPAGLFIDQEATPAPAPAAPAPAGPAAAGPARPTGWIQMLTPLRSRNGIPVADMYGFELKFRVRSTSGRVADLQSRAPTLLWREHVTYSRNDFAHRVSPPNPTILPAGGVPFSAAFTRRAGTNLLEFTRHTDAHWFWKDWVRAGDFAAAPGPAGPPARALPAEIHARQVYQYSEDGGGSWRYLAGAFNLRRRFFNDGGTLRFRTAKSGVHSVTEAYMP